MYTPEGKFYFHKNHRNKGTKFPISNSGIVHPSTENPNASPYMDLNYIGDAVGHNNMGFLENVKGTFIKFYNFYSQGIFLMGTTELIGPVRTEA